MNITAKQERALRYIKYFQGQNGYSPSIEEIRLELDYASTSTVHKLLRQLEARGAISRIPGAHRAITVLGDG